MIVQSADYDRLTVDNVNAQSHPRAHMSLLHIGGIVVRYGYGKLHQAKVVGTSKRVCEKFKLGWC